LRRVGNWAMAVRGNQMCLRLADRRAKRVGIRFIGVIDRRGQDDFRVQIDRMFRLVGQTGAAMPSTCRAFACLVVGLKMMETPREKLSQSRNSLNGNIFLSDGRLRTERTSRRPPGCSRA